MRKITLTEAEFDRLKRLVEWRVETGKPMQISKGYIISSMGFFSMKATDEDYKKQAKQEKDFALLKKILARLQ